MTQPPNQLTSQYVQEKPYATMGDEPRELENNLAQADEDMNPESQLMKQWAELELQQQQIESVSPTDFAPIQLLGKGSFGEVYLVQMRQNKKLYAMKVLQKDSIFDRHLVRYAVTERNVLSYYTKHPFIVGLNFAF